MAHKVLTLKLHCGEISINGEKHQLELPAGCIGISFAFESKKAAREYWGKDVPLVQIEENEGEK